MKSLRDAIGYSISGNMRWMHNNKNTSVFFQLLFYFMTLKGFFQNKTAVKQVNYFFSEEKFLGPMSNVRVRHWFFLQKDALIYLPKSSENTLNDVLRVLLAGGITNVRQCVTGPVETANLKQLQRHSSYYRAAPWRQREPSGCLPRVKHWIRN